MSLSMSRKTVIYNVNAIADSNTLIYDTRSIVHKNFFSNLAESLLIQFPIPPNKQNLKADLCLVGTTEKKVLKIMQDIEISKATGVDKLL